MQFADVFTGCVNRVVNRPADSSRGHPKDEVAEEVLALMGVGWRDIHTDQSTDSLCVIRL